MINQRQLAWLASSVITSGGILTLQNVLIRVSQMDAWYSYLLSIFYVFVIAAFFGYLAKVYPQKHIFEVSKEILGVWGGTIVNLLILFHFWQMVVRDISSMAKFSSTLLLHNTPLEILMLLPCLLLIYFGKGSMEVVARVNDLFYPLFVITIIMMPLLLSNEFYIQLMTPSLTIPFQHLAASNLLTLGGAGDVFILGAFLHMVYNANHIRSSIRHGTLLGIFLLTLLLFLIIVVLGPKMPGNFLYPTYNLVQMIHITDFLDRLDIIMLTIWFPTVACKIIAIYMALLLGISAIINERNYPIFNKPVALFIAITTFLSFKSTTELLSFSNFSSPIIVLIYQPLVMGLIFILSVRKQKKNPETVKSKDETDPTMNPSKQVKSRFTYKQWLWSGNLLLAFSTVCVTIGLMFSTYKPIIGIVCGLGFGCSLLLIGVTTYMEVSLLKQSQTGK
ncbi:endospore germination permease [Paenibacillus sp. N3.4]|uniref:GerAB/ArcD/ProY family transporter n=1 Tax=Paenibacillus sp. N3.4 TaxID=2603222 RepID=UPI001C9CF222|nr:endospore germination permease [Paenibacillus sp. N3.4]